MVLVGENRRYLSGFTGEDGQCDESAGALFITSKRQLLATDSRYITQAELEAPAFEIFEYKEGLASSLPEILKSLGSEHLGFEGPRLSYGQFRKMEKRLNSHAPSISLVPTEGLVEELRMIKEPDEIEKIRSSLALSEGVFGTLMDGLRPGISEKQLAWTMEKSLREAGADSIAFPPIVASGPNGALPHAVPSERAVAAGEPILFDWGARLEGYCSDISRTVVLGTPDDTFSKVYQVVKDAQSMAIEAIKPGVSSRDVDSAARNHIGDKGFKGFFGHALGHGVGLATHENPRLSAVRPMVLEAGMVTTVEPGIYIPGWGGVRLENMVVVQEGGAQVLNRHPL
jgi:Xaa-Pro aminopeptidase